MSNADGLPWLEIKPVDLTSTAARGVVWLVTSGHV